MMFASILSWAMGFLRIRWKAVLILAAAGVLMFVFWQWRSDIQDRVRAVVGYEQVIQALDEQKQALGKLRAENARVRRINAQYETRLENIRQSLRGLEYEIRDLETASEAVADWAGNPLPDPVLDRLRGEGPAHSDPDTNSTDPASPGMDATD
jgi:septal ring factor EnvC (AmiA/AmiB activator)